MKIEPFTDKGYTDQQEKTQGQYFKRWMLVHETADGSRSKKHDGDRDDHRYVHDPKLVDHPYRGDDAVDRKHEIQYQYLYDYAAE